jgi:ferritin
MNMPVQIELWQLITFLAGLLVSFLTFVFVAGRVLLNQVDLRLNARFSVLEDALKKHTEEEGKTADQVRELERAFMKWQAEMPLQYVRREDFVRNQTVIEAKIDRVYGKLEVVQLQGAQKHG